MNKRERERETAWRGLMVSASRMGLFDSFSLHWAECTSNNWASGPHSHFNLCTLARKMSHCLPHAHRCCGHCAAEAASLVTTTALQRNKLQNSTSMWATESINSPNWPSVISHWLKQSIWLRAAHSGGCGVEWHYALLSPVSTTRVDSPWNRLHFWHPSWRPELTGVKKCTQVDGSSTRVHFLTPVNSGRQFRCQKCTQVHGPSTRPVNSGSGNQALVVQARNDDDDDVRRRHGRWTIRHRGRTIQIQTGGRQMWIFRRCCFSRWIRLSSTVTRGRWCLGS